MIKVERFVVKHDKVDNLGGEIYEVRYYIGRFVKEFSDTDKIVKSKEFETVSEAKEWIESLIDAARGTNDN